MKRKFIALFILFIQLLFLIGMILYHTGKLRTADRILLKTIPYDPRSIFRGPYVSLTYEISSLPSQFLKDVKEQDVKAGDELYVGLAKKGDYWQADSIYKKRPNDAKAYLRGRVNEYWRYYSGDQGKKIPLTYGIESFFLNEERAKEVDKINTWQGGQWQAMDNEKDRRLKELDEEFYRIHNAGISDWWVKLLDKEIEAWVKQGIISQEEKNAIHDKYARAMEAIEKVENDVSSGNIPGRKPLIVQVAVDRNGNGYPVKLILDGKEYK